MLILWRGGGGERVGLGNEYGLGLYKLVFNAIFVGLCALLSSSNISLLY